MREVYFFTSNRAKLAHLKHIGRKHGLDVNGFRELTYFGPYEEPRIRDREKLLRESYESAASKWVKAFGETDSRIFMLEDTSVRIDALSESEDFPGVDVKYWMRGMTFGKLDAMLRERGNLRTATVRSDIVAHVPRRLRDTLSNGKPFIWVAAESKGKILDVEVPLTTNLVYPWLDSRSFNKWFVPEGSDSPMSALDIEAADSFDFRRKAFDQMVLEFDGLLRPDHPEATSEQLLLPGVVAKPPVLLICGYSCAGKSTLATWLSSKFGFLHLEASDYMWRAYWERHGTKSNIKIGEFAVAALKVEPWIAAAPIGHDLNAFGYSAAVVTGFRSPSEARELALVLGEERKVQILFVDAEFDTRLVRAARRGREPTDISSLRVRDYQERGMGLECIKKTSAVVVHNNYVRKESYFHVVQKAVKYEIEVLTGATQYADAPSVGGLEKYILLALLHTGEKTLLTTSEIAKAIKFLFGIEKSKNNISRYFHQEFHPFYRVGERNGKHVYRLSATGLSMANILNVHRAFPDWQK